MTRENAETKAWRLLITGRVVVRAVNARELLVVVRGETDEYLVRWRRGVGYTCTCPARSTCSHRKAAALVTVPPRGEQQPIEAPSISRGGGGA